jgi:hypothetical protein
MAIWRAGDREGCCITPVMAVGNVGDNAAMDSFF